VRIGLIADTHGYLGADAEAALAGCDRIVHAGDIGPGVLERLGGISPVIAVSGNNDLSGPEAALPLIASFDAGGRRISVVHRLVDRPTEGWDVLVFGHCHRTHADYDGGRLLINPGAAGRRGFHARRSVAVLALEHGVSWTFVDLGPRSAP
jgi:putative phosphoesterase